MKRNFMRYPDIDFASVSCWLRYQQHAIELEILKLRTADLTEYTIPNLSEDAILEPFACEPSYFRYELLEKRQAELEKKAEFLHKLYIQVEHECVRHSEDFLEDLQLAEVGA